MPAEAPAAVAALVQSLTDPQLEELGVPIGNPDVVFHRDRVFLPVGTVRNGAFDVASQPIRKLGFPTATLVFRATSETKTVVFSLAASVPVTLEVASGPNDAIDLGTIRLSSPSIPAVSEWSMLALGMLILTAGTLVVRKGLIRHA